MSQKVERDFYSRPSNMIDDLLGSALAEERARLVRFCASLAGNADAAEDLAQETILEAWRNQQKLCEQGTNRENLMRWIFAIARNVCMRWKRSHGRDRTHLMLFKQYEDETELCIEDIADDCDVEVELERDELAQLLDQALALLPATIRDVLIERYIHESSHTEIAERLSLSEDALVQRLYRGKLALRRVITTHMNAEAAAYGLAWTDEEGLQEETRIWCPLCGTRRLLKDYNPVTGCTRFACPNCRQIAAGSNPQLWNGVNSPKSILARQLVWLDKYYRQVIQSGQGVCSECGGPTRAEIYRPQDILAKYRSIDIPIYHGVFIICTICQREDMNMLPHLTLDIPEARLFWRKHPRMVWLPGHEVEYAGQPALVGSFQSMTDAAQIDVIYQRETLIVLDTHEFSHA